MAICLQYSTKVFVINFYSCIFFCFTHFFYAVQLKSSSPHRFQCAALFFMGISVLNLPMYNWMVFWQEKKRKRKNGNCYHFHRKAIFSTSSSINSNCVSSVRDFMQINMLIHLNSWSDYISDLIEMALNDFMLLLPFSLMLDISKGRSSREKKNYTEKVSLFKNTFPKRLFNTTLLIFFIANTLIMTKNKASPMTTKVTATVTIPKERQETKKNNFPSTSSH